MSRRPKRCTAVVTRRSTSPSTVTSVGQATTRWPADSSADVAPFRAFSSLSASTTVAPSAAISAHVADPMAPPAPVTIATLPSKRPTGATSWHGPYLDTGTICLCGPVRPIDPLAQRAYGAFTHQHVRSCEGGDMDHTRAEHMRKTLTAV